jgi:hypothetical protein
LKRDGLKPVDDRKIIERVLKGDTDAFNLLVRQWEKPIYNFIVRMIGDREEAMDLCQEAFMKAYRELDSLRISTASRHGSIGLLTMRAFQSFERTTGKRSSNFNPKPGPRERLSRAGWQWKRRFWSYPKTSVKWLS